MTDATAGNPIASPPSRTTRVTKGGAAIGILVAVILALVVGGYLLYSSDQAQLADSRQSNATLSQQLAKAQQETKDSQAELDSTKQQLARAQAETADAQAAGKALQDQLGQAKDQLQQAQAQAKALQGDKDSLSTQLLSSQKATQDAEKANAAANQKMNRALARAQLVDQFVKIGFTGSSSDQGAQTLTWLTSLKALGDPTIDGYLQAFMKNPDDETPLNKLIVYLSDSVVKGLQ